MARQCWRESCSALVRSTWCVVALTFNGLTAFRPDGSSLEIDVFARDFAIHPGGTLYYVDDGESEGNGGGSADLVGLDIGFGSGPRIPLPQGTLSGCTGGTIEAPQGCTSTNSHFGFGTPTVVDDGSVVLPVVTGHQYTVGSSVPITHPFRFDHEISLLILRPDRTTEIQRISLPTEQSTVPITPLRPFKAIPNGQGGLIVAWDRVLGLEFGAPFASEAVGVSAAGAMTSAVSGFGQGWAELVLSEEPEGDSATVWALTLLDGQRRVLSPLTPEGNLRSLSFIQTPQDAIQTMRAERGGGLLLNLVDGRLWGSSDDYEQLQLRNAYHLDAGLWRGSGSSGSLAKQGPEFLDGGSDWPSGAATNWANATDDFRSNYNATELLTNETPSEIFANYVKSFDGVNAGTVARVIGVPVEAVGQILAFSLLGWPSYFQDPFSVEVIQLDQSASRISAATPSNHPLIGWRYWRVFQRAPGRVVIETGAVDKLQPWVTNLIGELTPRFWKDQLQIWEQYLLYIRDNLSATQGTDSTYHIPGGRWNYDKFRIMGHVCFPSENVILNIIPGRMWTWGCF
jgi:hypothetical protein